MCTIFEKFDLYDAIIAYDYMQHQAITAGLREELARFQRPLNVVDVGCGNGWMARGCLRDVLVAGYTGIDLSADALERVKANPPLGRLPSNGQLNLLCDDLFLVLPSLQAESMDVVLGSFSIHHFSTEQKQQLLGQIARVLVKDGLFIWTDVNRKTGQTRDEFNASLAKHMRELWTKLPMEHRESVVTHIQAYDFPEELDWMIRECEKVGLTKSKQIYRDDHYGSWVFQR